MFREEFDKAVEAHRRRVADVLRRLAEHDGDLRWKLGLEEWLPREHIWMRKRVKRPGGSRRTLVSVRTRRTGAELPTLELRPLLLTTRELVSAMRAAAGFRESERARRSWWTAKRLRQAARRLEWSCEDLEAASLLAAAAEALA